MTPEEMTQFTDPDTKTLIGEVVDILGRLKNLDVDRIDHILTLAELARPICPPTIMKAMDSMKVDFELVKIFSEQAKKYDQLDNAIASYEKWFGKEAKNE